MVGVDGRLVYESLVCPENSIIDFNTRYSGISAKDFGKLTIIRTFLFYNLQNYLLACDSL